MKTFKAKVSEIIRCPWTPSDNNVYSTLKHMHVILYTSSETHDIKTKRKSHGCKRKKENVALETDKIRSKSILLAS